jgi:cytochrome c oxidase cbb3-type subunit 3
MAIGGLCLVVSCGGGEDRQAALEAPPVSAVPVGPLPGPAEFEPGEVNPFARDKEAFASGRRIFIAYNCAGCHGDHGGGGMGPSLRDRVWLYGSSHEQIAQSIAEGRAYGMPAWRQMLTAAQVWQVTAYIKTLRTPDEPSPPS